MEARRVTPANLEAVDAAQRLVHCEVAGQLGRQRVSPGERLDRRNRTQPVVAECPEHIFEVDQLGVGRFQRLRTEPSGVGVEFGLDRCAERIELVEPRFDRRHDIDPTDKRQYTRQPSQSVIN